MSTHSPSLPLSLPRSLLRCLSVSRLFLSLSLYIYIYINMEICAYTFVSNRLSQKNSMVDFRPRVEGPTGFCKGVTWFHVAAPKRFAHVGSDVFVGRVALGWDGYTASVPQTLSNTGTVLEFALLECAALPVC